MQVPTQASLPLLATCFPSILGPSGRVALADLTAPSYIHVRHTFALYRWSLYKDV